MKSDLQFLLIDRDPQISVVHIVVVLEDKSGRGHGWLIFEVMNVSSKVWLAWEVASFAFHHTVYVVASIATYDERHFIVPIAETNTSGEPLIVVRVSGQESVWIHARAFANSVDVAQHGWTASVIETSATGLFRRGIAERR